MARLIYFGPHIIDCDGYTIAKMEEMIAESLEAEKRLEEWIKEDEDEEN